MSANRLKISQCMIVKNEAKNIVQALSWGKHIMWEQIVVDTGSTDETVELAKSMGANVYHFSWIDDFSAAKNFALSKAHGDWIAFLDADEYLTNEWTEQLLSMLEKAEEVGCCAVRSLIASIDTKGELLSVSRNCRFFRNRSDLRFRNAIHEMLTLNGQTLNSACMMDVGNAFPIYHTGYSPEVMETKGTNERNIRILKKELEKRPDDYDMMGYLGDSYNQGDGEENREAEQYYRRALQHMPQVFDVQDERSAATVIRLMALLADRGDEDEFFELYEDAIGRADWVYDFDYMAGMMHFKRNDYRKAITHLEKALYIIEGAGSYAYGTLMNKNIGGVWETLAQCHYYNMDYASCIRYCVTLLKEDPQRDKILILLLQVLKNEKAEEVIGLLEKIYDIHQPMQRVILIKGILLAKAHHVLPLIEMACTKEELDFIKQMKEKIG